MGTFFLNVCKVRRFKREFQAKCTFEQRQNGVKTGAPTRSFDFPRTPPKSMLRTTRITSPNSRANIKRGGRGFGNCCFAWNSHSKRRKTAFSANILKKSSHYLCVWGDPLSISNYLYLSPSISIYLDLSLSSSISIYLYLSLPISIYS